MERGIKAVTQRMMVGSLYPPEPVRSTEIKFFEYAFEIRPSSIVKENNLGLFTKKRITKGIQFHYHGKIQLPSVGMDHLIDTMYVLAIQNNRIEINARPITYLNSPVQQMFYPMIMG
jgi:hypothetical protein